MAQGKLTKRTVDAAKSGFTWDTKVRGFGLKVTGRGKIFILQYRMGGRGSPTQRYTIGTLGSPWTTETARDEALRLLAKVKSGIDPQAEKQAARAGKASEITFAELAARWLERYAKEQTRDWRNTNRMLDHDVLPFWRGRDIKSLKKSDVIALLDRVTDRGAKVHANRVLSAVRSMLNWAVGRDLLEANPCVGVRPPGAEVARDRVLSACELAAVWDAAGAAGYPFGPCVQLLILTAQRRDEVAGMRWTEIDLEARLWTIPAERAKNGRAHEVPLNGPAVAILEGLREGRSLSPDGGGLVFSTTGKTPISGFGKAKARLDEASGVTGWRLHDLRRTATTGMAQAGVAPHIVDRILNHVSGAIRGVAAVYNRFGYLEDRRQALELWGRIVTERKAALRACA